MVYLLTQHHIILVTLIQNIDGKITLPAPLSLKSDMLEIKNIYWNKDIMQSNAL